MHLGERSKLLGNIGDLFVNLYETSHKRPFVPSALGIRLLCDVREDIKIPHSRMAKACW